MKKKLFAFSIPMGLVIYLIYSLGNRFFGALPDCIAYPMMIVSIILMVIGLVYNGYCLGKRKNPYDIK